MYKEAEPLGEMISRAIRLEYEKDLAGKQVLAVHKSFEGLVGSIDWALSRICFHEKGIGSGTGGKLSPNVLALLRDAPKIGTCFH